MRSIDAQLLDVQLMSSTPEHVFAWLKHRSEAQGEEAYEGDDHLEAALLTRKSDLIDLGLARYGRSADVVRELFRRECPKQRQEGLILSLAHDPAPNRPNALRLAALSNRVFAKDPLWPEALPQTLFGLDRYSTYLDPIREFVIAASDDEVRALFRNPSIDSGILTSLYKKAPPFDILSEEQWQRLIDATIRNLRLSPEYVGPFSLDREYEHDKVFDAAWTLAEKVPTTTRWARTLRSLLYTTCPKSFSIRDTFRVIQRWRVDTAKEPDPESAKVSQPADGFLDDFGFVRLVLARLLSIEEIEGLKGHEDVAMRCAFYHFGSPTPQELKGAHAKEPRFLLNYAIDNDAIWKRVQTREALLELCWADKSDLDLKYQNDFKAKSERMQREHPDWFREDQSERRPPYGPPQILDPDILLNITSSIHTMQARTVTLLEALEIRTRVNSWILWVLLAAVVLIVLKRC